MHVNKSGRDAAKSPMASLNDKIKLFYMLIYFSIFPQTGNLHGGRAKLEDQTTVFIFIPWAWTRDSSCADRPAPSAESDSRNGVSRRTMPSPTYTALGLLLISNDVTLKEDRVGTLFPHNLKPSLHPLSHEMQRSRNRVVSTSRLARLGKSLPSALLAAKPATLHDYISKTLKPHFRGRFVGTAASTEEIIRIATKGAKTSYIFSQWLQSTIARHLSQHMILSTIYGE